MFMLLSALLLAAIYFTSPPKRSPGPAQTFSFDEFKNRHDFNRKNKNEFTKRRPFGTIDKAAESKSCKILPFNPRKNKK